MAVIGKIRKHSGLVIVIIGVALAAFVLGDFIKPSNKYQTNYIGEIAGVEIPITDFNEKVEEQVQFRKEQQKTEDITQEDAYQIRQSVWNKLVEDIIMGLEYEKLGLTITSDELSEQIIGENPHQYVLQSFKNPNTGQFDQGMVIEFIQNLDQQTPDMKRRYLNLEEMVKEDRLSTKYKNLISKAYHIPTAFAKMDYEAKNKNVSFRYVAPKFSSVSDSLVVVDDDDLMTYYNEHKNNYMQDETRAVDFVIFEVNASPEDRKEIANNVNRIYGEFKNTEDNMTFVNSVSDDRYDSAYKKEADLPARIAKQMFESPIGTMVGPYLENEIYHISKLIDKQQRPDSIRESQILISYATAPAGQGISERTREDAETLADSLLNVLKKSPGKYENIAVEFSDYPTVEEDKGDLDWIEDGNPALARFFNAGLGEKKDAVKIIESPLGYHVIKITDKTKPVEKVRIAMITRAIEPSNETFQDMYLKASEFAGENRTLAKFDTAVLNQGLNKRTADRLTPMLDRIAGVENPRQIIRWAFYDNTILGDVSRVFEDGKNYIVAVLKEVKEKGNTPFEQIKEQITPLVINLKKGDIIVERIKETGTTDLYELAAKMDEKVDTTDNINFTSRNIPGFGREYEVIGKLATLEPDKLAEPIKGNNAVFVIYLDTISEPAQTDNYSLYANQLKSSFTSSLNSKAVFRALEKKSEIQDNRIFFY